MAFWDKLTTRGQVEDRRSFAPTAIGGLSLGGIALLFLFNYLAGGDITDILSQLQNVPVEQQQYVDTTAFEGDDSYEVFTSTVLGSNNDMWTSVFNRSNQEYTPPKLVLFRTATESQCGGATSEVGPHYCPIDQTIYLDETFFDELTRRFGAQGGDVAEAYVISHEVGHHVQNLMGNLEQVQQSRSNKAAIALELQADCFAGLWANSVKDLGVLEVGEIREAIDAAAAVGDDRIQKSVTGYVNPETWTHGSSDQRVSWFNKGFNEGTFASCDTFR